MRQLSLSNTETTLWDQFDYAGAPESFGWILPVKGVAEVGLSSDALFDALGQVTAPQIFAPAQNCPNSCLGGGGGSDGSGGGSNGGGVVVVAQDVVGPFETVQIKSQDPNALKAWLTQNGYPIPAGVASILDAYVAEGFDFVALKLLPGQGLDSVKPVRVTVQGAAPSIPLRLLAAGTGDLTPVTLFVLGEGRWEPTNAPRIEMKETELAWDFQTDSSNYAAVRAEKLKNTGGLGWLVEQAKPLETFLVDESLQALVSADPQKSGYGDGAAVTPQAALDAESRRVARRALEYAVDHAAHGRPRAASLREGPRARRGGRANAGGGHLQPHDRDQRARLPARSLRHGRRGRHGRQWQRRRGRERRQ